MLAKSKVLEKAILLRTWFFPGLGRRNVFHKLKKKNEGVKLHIYTCDYFSMCFSKLYQS